MNINRRKSLAFVATLGLVAALCAAPALANEKGEVAVADCSVSENTVTVTVANLSNAPATATVAVDAIVNGQRVRAERPVSLQGGSHAYLRLDFAGEVDQVVGPAEIIEEQNPF